MMLFESCFNIGTLLKMFLGPPRYQIYFHCIIIVAKRISIENLKRKSKKNNFFVLSLFKLILLNKWRFDSDKSNMSLFIYLLKSIFLHMSNPAHIDQTGVLISKYFYFHKYFFFIVHSSEYQANCVVYTF